MLEPFSWILTHWKVQCLPFTCDWNHLSLVWATFTVYRSYIRLCDFMFCNTYILFFELFMCKVLGLGFFYYKARTYFFIFFGLGLELETNQAFQPLTPPCPPNMPWKDKKWMKVGSKWKCKVGTCLFAYRAKWLLTKHLKEVHGLVAKKGQTWEAFWRTPKFLVERTWGSKCVELRKYGTWRHYRPPALKRGRKAC